MAGVEWILELSRPSLGLWHTPPPSLWVGASLFQKIGEQDVKWLRWKCAYNVICGGQHWHTLFKCFGVKGLDTRSSSCYQCSILSVWFKDDMSCYTNRDWRLFDMFAMFPFAEKCDFMRLCRLLMRISAQNCYRLRALWHDLVFGWQYPVHEFIYKRDTKKYIYI